MPDISVQADFADFIAPRAFPKSTARYAGVDDRMRRYLNSVFSSTFHQFGPLIIDGGRNLDASSDANAYFFFDAGITEDSRAHIQLRGSSSTEFDVVGSIVCFCDVADAGSGISFMRGAVDGAGYIALMVSDGTTESYVLQAKYGEVSIHGTLEVNGPVNLGAQTELTIATGAITATRAYHTVDTELDAASDDLDTINGGAEGDMLVLRANNTARTVVVKDGTGNMSIAGDFEMDSDRDTITLLFNGTQWIEMSRVDKESTTGALLLE